MNNVCVICLDDIIFEHKNKNTILICDHVFHTKCINKYLKKNKHNQLKCPLCKDLIQESFNEIDDYACDIYDKLNNK